MSRTHGESFLKTSLQASTVHMQAVAISRHMLGIYNTFSPSPSFLLFDRGTDRQEHTRPRAHCSPHTWFIQCRYGCIKDSNINGESHDENAKASHAHKQPHIHRQTDVQGNLPTLNTLKNTSRHLTAVPGWWKKNEEGTICSSKHTAGYGNNSLSQHTCTQLSACKNRQVTEIKINYKDNPKWIPLLRHWKSFETSGLWTMCRHKLCQSKTDLSLQ